MNDDGIVMSHLVLELPDRFQEGLALDIAHGAAGLDDGNMHVLGGVIPIEPALDLIGNMRNDLYGPAAVIASAFLLQDRPVDLAGGDVGILVQTFVNKTLIMSQIQIRLGPVIGDKYFAVLDRVHGSGINIDVRVEFLHGDLVAPRLQKASQ